MQKIIIILTLIMSVMLFANNPLNDDMRILMAIWNMGHLVFFALFTWLLLSSKKLKLYPWLTKLFIALFVGLSVGAGIEVVQFFIGRYMEIQDLVMDGLGILLGYLLLFLHQSEGAASKNKILLVFAAITSVLLLASYPLIKIIIDEKKMQSKFPLLADFESADFLQAHWEYNDVSSFGLNHKVVKEGQSSLFVQFEIAQYPSVTFMYFPADWQAYEQLNISVHNDQAENLMIEFKVMDQAHRLSGYAYSDRFNREFELQPGWNDLKIRLLDVYRAPENRSMDLQGISEISLFLNEPLQPKSLHIDNIYLSK